MYFFDLLLCVSISCHYWFSFIICICNTQNKTYTVHTVHVLAVIGSAQCANSQRISSAVLSYRERKKQILNRELAMIFAFAFFALLWFKSIHVSFNQNNLHFCHTNVLMHSTRLLFIFIYIKMRCVFFVLLNLLAFQIVVFIFSKWLSTQKLLKTLFSIRTMVKKNSYVYFVFFLFKNCTKKSFPKPSTGFKLLLTENE